MTVYSAIFAAGIPESGPASYTAGSWKPCPPGYAPCCLADRGEAGPTSAGHPAWSQGNPDSITRENIGAWADRTIRRLLRESPSNTPLIGLDFENPAALTLVARAIEYVRDCDAAREHLDAGGNLRVGFWLDRLFAAASPWGDGPRVAAAAAGIRDAGWVRSAIDAGGTPLCCVYPSFTEIEYPAIARLSMAIEPAVWRSRGVEPVLVVAPTYSDPGPNFTPEFRASTLSALCDTALLDAQFRAANFNHPQEGYDTIVWGAPIWKVSTAPGGGPVPIIDGTHEWRVLEPRLRPYVGAQPAAPK